MQPIHLLAAGCSELPRRDGSSNGVHSRRNRDGTKQLYGIRPTRVPTSRRRCLLFPSKGNFGNAASQKPLRATRRPSKTASSIPHPQPLSQRERGARSGDAGLPGAFPRNRDLDGTRGRQSQRIGSVRERLCTWAASAGSCERKPAVTDAAANQSVRGRAFAAGESYGIDVPDVDSRAMRSLHCASVRQTARRAGPRLVQLVLYMSAYRQHQRACHHGGREGC